MKHLLDKGGALGALMAAVAAPCCFPLLAPNGFALGFGALLPWAEYALYGVAACAVVAMVGNIIAFRSHHRLGWLLFGVGTGQAHLAIERVFRYSARVTLPSEAPCIDRRTPHGYACALIVS